MSNHVHTDEFEKWLEFARKGGHAGSFLDAAIHVHDTLYAAWKSVKTIFGEQATPQLAAEICRQMMAEHERLRAEIARRNATESRDEDL